VRQQDLLAAGLILILVWMPLPFGSNQPMYWVYGEVALQALTLVVLVMLSLGSLGISDAFRGARLPLSIFLFFVVSQLTINHWPGVQWSADQSATNAQLIKSICLFEVFCLTLLLITNEQRFKWLVVTLLVAGTFQAIYGTLMTVTGTDYIWNYQKVQYKGVATGTFVNRNHLAGYLEMTLALGLGLMIANLGEGRSRTWRQFFRSWAETLLGPKVRIRVCLILMVIGLILTRSRMGNTAFFVGMGIAGMIGLFVFRKSQTGVVALFVSILVIDILLLGTFFGLEELQQRLERTNVEGEQRLVVILSSLDLVHLAPWLGHGLGTFYTIFPLVRNHEVVHYYDHAHSDLLQFPLEVGIVGMFPLVALFILAFYMAFRVQVTRHNRFYRAMGFSVTMAMISIGLHSSSDFNLQIFANAATFVCIMAMPWLAMYLPSRRKSGST
jgi:O-antigen ligase